MSDTPNLTLLVAFAGGLLSFLSPCVLPLVPSYLGFITGFTINEMTKSTATFDRTRLNQSVCGVTTLQKISNA